MKDSIIDRIRMFFCNGFDGNGYKIDPKYDRDVLSLNRSPLYASLTWLKSMQAINDDDIATHDRIKFCRNQLAHRLLNVLGNEGLPPEFDGYFEDMIGLLHKIEVWWIVNVEIPTNPDFDGSEIDVHEIIPGPVMTFQMLLKIALGTDQESRILLEAFRKRREESEDSKGAEG